MTSGLIFIHHCSFEMAHRQLSARAAPAAHPAACPGRPPAQPVAAGTPVSVQTGQPTRASADLTPGPSRHPAESGGHSRAGQPSYQHRRDGPKQCDICSYKQVGEKGLFITNISLLNIR